MDIIVGVVVVIGGGGILCGGCFGWSGGFGGEGGGMGNIFRFGGCCAMMCLKRGRIVLLGQDVPNV